MLAAGRGEERVAGAGDVAFGRPAGGSIGREGPAEATVLEAADSSEDGGLGGRSCEDGGGGWKWTAGPPGLATVVVGDLERSVPESFRIWNFVGEPNGIDSGADRLSPCFALC